MNESMSLLFKKIGDGSKRDRRGFPWFSGRSFESRTSIKNVIQTSNEISRHIGRSLSTCWRHHDMLVFWLVVEPTHLKNMLVKLDHCPQIGMEIKKYAKPPPSFDVISWMKNMMKSSILLAYVIPSKWERCIHHQWWEKKITFEIPTKICTLGTSKKKTSILEELFFVCIRKNISTAVTLW